LFYLASVCGPIEFSRIFSRREGELCVSMQSPFSCILSPIISNIRRCYVVINMSRRDSSTQMRGEEPSRDADGAFHFRSFPQFLPNRSPKEILQAGSFGGTYFRPIKSAVCPNIKFGDEVWKELPEDWIKDLDPAIHLNSATYRSSVNMYGVKCGATLEEWEQSDWIKPQVCVHLCCRD
jgi:hypothetical protein